MSHSQRQSAPASGRGNHGVTVWLTGLPGAGKSTLAEAVQCLARDAVGVAVLDGDELRTSLSADLGFSKGDRETHAKRVGFVAELLSRNGILTLVPVIAPYAGTRAATRAHHDQHGTAFLEVHVSTPLSECERRDPKGLYAKAHEGRIVGLTGVDDPYERPVAPDLRVDTTDIEVGTAAHRILDVLTEHGFLDAGAIADSSMAAGRGGERCSAGACR
ncbi:MAG: adenylyl-sulfate kinase [Sciscionella sp.]